jgi:thiol:disulfide interchange protein DsbD
MRAWLIASFLFIPLFTAAAAGLPGIPPQAELHVRASLASEEKAVQPGTPFTVALVLEMDTDWHVYWKNPGDSGIPTTITWDLPPGFSARPLQWPVPQRFVTDGLVTYGYSGRVLLLTEIVPPSQIPAAGSVLIRAKAAWLACRVECVPGAASLSLGLPVSAAAPTADPAWRELFAATRAALPVRDAAVLFTATSDARHVALSASGLDIPPGAAITFAPSEPGAVADSARQIVRLDAKSVSLTMERPANAAALARLNGVLFIAAPGSVRAFEVDTAVSAAPSTGASGLLLALLLAFVGGLILNLMPCVLPVISLKVLSFLRHSGEGGASAARNGFLFGAGVLVSFWAIAGLLMILRSTGQALGWGFQFQNPVVVAVAALLFFAIGLNLFGVFELGTGVSRVAGQGQRRGGGGAFVSGLFATAVATPCTAPFMGVAVGYALTHSLAANLGVFTALGIGMAAPYVTLSLAPGLAARLPKPGQWMETFRQVMGFPMMAAVVWMLFVLSALAGGASVVVLLGCMLAVGAGAWVWGRWGALSRPRGARIAALCMALVLCAAGCGFAVASVTRSTAAVPETASAPVGSQELWQPWSPAREAALRAQGVPVFIDFSARWCLSCQVNERVALDNAAVHRMFKDRGIATLRADWTDKNAEIAGALAGYGRAGVPLYVLYTAGASEPVLLPELLTPGIVTGALGRVGTPPR